MNTFTYYKIYRLAQKVRTRILRDMETDITHGLCHYASDKLMKALRGAGIRNLKLISGFFKVDYPNFEYCGNYVSGEIYFPGHYWLELNGFIIDITADQFNEELHKDDMEEIVIDKYAEVPRYRKE